MSQINEIPFADKIYIDLKQVLPLRPYAAGCASIKKLIAKKQYRDVINGRIVDGALVQTEKRSCKYGSVYVNKSEVMELFQEDSNAVVEHPPAPPVIEDEDLIFFKDEDGEEYDVLMRGSRTREGIYFKVKDVESVFQMKRLDDIISKEHTVYIPARDYQWFALGNANSKRNTRSKELYLTYSGLMHVMEASKSGIGYKFKQWINDIVFAAAFGTTEQKAKAFARPLNTDVEHLNAVLKKTSNDISCLYLFDIKDTSDEGKPLYKFGYSKQLRDRTRQHIAKYGDNIELIRWVFVPRSLLSTAEKRLKDCIRTYSYPRKGDTELISLDAKELECVLATYQSISRDFSGHLTELTNRYEHETELLRKDIALADSRSEVAHQRCEVLQAKLELEQMRNSMLIEKLKAAGISI